jgi:hypothetical protein
VDIRGAVDLIGPLAQLSAAANNTEVPELYRLMARAQLLDAPAAKALPEDSTVARRVRDLMDSAGVDERARASFVRRIASLIAVSGRSDVADDILRTFDLPQETEPPATDGPDSAWTVPPIGTARSNGIVPTQDRHDSAPHSRS